MSHESSPSAGPLPFTQAEIEGFQQSDRSAATAIIVLMAGIFSIGLLGYSTVCLWIIG